MANYADYTLQQLIEAREMIANALRRTQKELEEVDGVLKERKQRENATKEGAAA